MYNAVSIANFFIAKANTSNIEITLMKVIKLVYISHGWNLCLKSEPLINEAVQAWQYGPVIPSVYHAFKMHGKKPIPAFANVENQVEFDNDTETLLNGVWEIYKHLDGLQLSTMTHKDGTPWTTARQNNANVISDEIIKNFYAKKLKNGKNNPVKMS